MSEFSYRQFREFMDDYTEKNISTMRDDINEIMVTLAKMHNGNGNKVGMLAVRYLGEGFRVIVTAFLAYLGIRLSGH